MIDGRRCSTTGRSNVLHIYCDFAISTQAAQPAASELRYCAMHSEPRLAAGMVREEFLQSEGSVQRGHWHQVAHERNTNAAKQRHNPIQTTASI